MPGFKMTVGAAATPAEKDEQDKSDEESED